MSIATLRSEAATALSTAGLKAAEYITEQFTAPIAVVVPSDPYVTVGELFGQYNVNLSILLIAGKGTNKSVATALDQLITDAINALDADWDLTEVSQPGQVSINGSNYLGAVVTVSQTTKLGAS